MENSSRLRAWRKAIGISQDEAATKVGVHQNTWSDWENARKVPSTEAAIRLDVLTAGACPIEGWSDDPQVRQDMRAALHRRALTTGTDGAR